MYNNYNYVFVLLGGLLLRGGGQITTITTVSTLTNYRSILSLLSLLWSRVSSPQFFYWLGQAGIVHIGFGQRVLTVVCEIREKNDFD